MTKKCKQCKKQKDVEEFQKDRRRKDGITHLCKPCAADYANDWHRKNRDRHNANMKAWREEDRRKNPGIYIWRLAKRRAKEIGRPFSIKPSDVVVPEVCPALGIRLAFTKGSCSACTPSIDAIIPELGYIPGNIAIISHLANSIKQNATPEQIRQVANWLERVLQPSPPE